MTTAVSIENVSIVFGDAPQRALPLMDAGGLRADILAQTGQTMGVHDCSIQIAQGETLVLMGLSGSGKSTLLRAINGLNPVARGQVQVTTPRGTVDVTHARGAALRALRARDVSMVFQQFALLPWRSVAQNVALGLELAGMPKTQIADSVADQLALVGLSDWADKPVSALSGGMQQRVGLARAFATQAPILLMDEPFSALDPLIRSKLQDDLMDLQARLKRTIIFVSHDLDEAFKIGDRIALMEEGRIVQCGTPTEIYKAPATPYVAEFVAHMNPLSILTAADIADPALLGGDPLPEVPGHMPLMDVMQNMSKGSDVLAVRQQDRLIGGINSTRVFRALSGADGA
jgi:glycine betaine/proline transport system ATP-binding protein